MPHEEESFTFLDEGGRVEVMLPPRPAELLRPLRGCAMGCGLVISLPLITVLAAILLPLLAAWAVVPPLLLILLVILLARALVQRVEQPPRLWLEGGRLWMEERLILFRMRRSQPLKELRRLTVMPFQIGRRQEWTQAGLLVAEVTGGQALPLAIGYRTDQLLVLARELQSRLPELAARHDWEMGSLAPVHVQGSEGIVGDLGPARTAPQPRPAESLVQCEQTADGVTLTVPAVGAWRGSGGLFLFGVIWTLLTSVLAVVLLVFFQQLANLPTPFLILSVIFPLLGLIFLVLGWALGRRAAVFAKVGDLLMVLQTGAFGNRRHEWSVADVAAINVGPSNVQVNGRPLPQLRIQLKEGAEYNFLLGRSAEELAWIADELAVACGCFRPTATTENVQVDPFTD